VSPSKFDRDYGIGEIEIRSAYESLHDLLDEGLKENGFTREFEAISFVSSLYSYVMDHKFISGYISIVRKHFRSRDAEELIIDVRKMLTELTSTVTADAVDLGVSPFFVSKFFTQVNTKATASFSKALTSKNLSAFRGEKEYLSSCLLDLYDYMKECLVSAKETDYSTSFRMSTVSDAEIYLLFLAISIMCFGAIIVI